MSQDEQDDAAREVVAMQFAGGKTVAQLAEEWERCADWVEESIRRSLLEMIPRRDGGMKLSRSEARAQRSEELQGVREKQTALEW
jgi:hypothetical protein